MRYLKEEDILKIHSRLIDKVGGIHGIRDINLLISATNRPRQTFNNKDLYPDLFSKAAALMESLIKNHPFIDGNKRTAITAAARFLYLNSYELKVKNKTLENFTLKVAQGKLTLKQIANWFKKNSRKIK